MKKKLAILLSFVFILTAAVPAGGFAANMDKALENAIKIAKSKFEIPDDYKFTSSISTENKKNIFNLNWRSTDTAEAGSVSVRIDENGTVVGYSKYSQSDYAQTKKLPKYSRQDAETKADSYIKEIEPGLLDKIKYEENYQSNVTDTAYYLTYYRVVNGIPFYNDRVTLSINKETGELLEYSRQWTDKLTFPSAAGVMPEAKARQAYGKNIGIRLIYKYSYTDDALKIFTVYTPAYGNSEYAINAVTGERQRIYSNNYYGYNEKVMATSTAKSIREAEQDTKLSPDELKAVQNASKLMSQDEAEKIARKAGFLDLPADAKLQSSYLDANWPSKEEYMWSLSFNKPADEKNKYGVYTSVTINARTGEITSFYRGGQPADANSKTRTDKATAKAAVEKFLKENYPKYYRQSEYNEQASEGSYIGDTDMYYFVYSRIVNGTSFPDNGMYVNYSNTSGTITGFNLNWFNVAFPSTDKAIGTTAASDLLFKNVGLGLEYKFDYQSNTEMIKSGYPSENSKVVLVYSLKPDKPLFLDANTGSLLNSDGSIFKEAAKVSYSDIRGNAAEKQIMALADNGVYLEGTEFKPDTNITQKDFLTLLSKTMSYYGPVITDRSTDKEIDDLYAFMQREGIVKAGEKAPSGEVTKEMALKFLIRALKYDKVADIKGIFNLDLKDKASVGADIAGYVAIAAGLGIIDVKNADFNPKAKLTRGESAIIIYNYLQS